MKLIEILPNVYGVKVPIDAEDFKKYHSQKNKWYVEYSKIYILNEIPIGFDFKILGTLTKDEISFDASEVVGKIRNSFIQKTFYLNYKSTAFASGRYTFDNAEQSFRSALPEEIYFENPFEEPKEVDCVMMLNKCENSFNKINNYQTAQENITQKLLILQKL